MKNQNTTQKIALIGVIFIFITPTFTKIRLLSEESSLEKNQQVPEDRPIPARHQRNGRLHSLSLRKRRCLPNDNLFTNMYHEDCGPSNYDQMCGSPILPHCAPIGKCASKHEIENLYPDRDRLWKKYDYHKLPDFYLSNDNEEEKDCKAGTFVGPRFDEESSHTQYWVGSAISGAEGDKGLGAVAIWKDGEVHKYEWPICKERWYHNYPAIECTSDRSEPDQYHNISFTGCYARRYPYWGAWLMCDRLETMDCMHDKDAKKYYCGNKARSTAQPLVFEDCEIYEEFSHMINKSDPKNANRGENYKCSIKEHHKIVETYIFEMKIIPLVKPDEGKTMETTNISKYLIKGENKQHYFPDEE